MTPLLNVILAALVLPSAHAAEGPERPSPHVGESGEPGHRVHLRLDTAATWGIGGQMFLGVQVHPTAYVGVWNTKKATGTIDLGVNVAYGNEPTFLAPWIDPAEVTGATHRVQVLGTVGTTFHMAPKRRFGLGIHWFAGLNHWQSDYRVAYADEDFEGEATVVDDLFVTGGQLTLSYRFSRHVGVNLAAVAPLPLDSSYAITFGHIGLGLTFYAL